MEKQEKLTTIDIKKLIKEEGHIRKFHGIAPEGFVLVHDGCMVRVENGKIIYRRNE